FASLPREAAALYLNYPSNPCAICAPPGVFDEAVHWAEETGTVVVHDLAYADLVFDGREPHSFLAVPGSKEVGVELYSMSKTYGMAGWRLGFVVGNAEVVARINLLTTHLRSGVFRPVQEAGIAALRGPQDSVEARRGTRRSARRGRSSRDRTPPPCSRAHRACRRGSPPASAASRPRPAGSRAPRRTRGRGASSRSGRRPDPGSERGGRRRRRVARG